MNKCDTCAYGIDPTKRCYECTGISQWQPRACALKALLTEVAHSSMLNYAEKDLRERIKEAIR